MHNQYRSVFVFFVMAKGHSLARYNLYNEIERNQYKCMLNLKLNDNANMDNKKN